MRAVVGSRSLVHPVDSTAQHSYLPKVMSHEGGQEAIEGPYDVSPTAKRLDIGGGGGGRLDIFIVIIIVIHCKAGIVDDVVYFDDLKITTTCNS